MNMPQQEVSEERTIIDDTVIRKVKHYIAHKHPGFTAEERAAVLDNAIHRIIDIHLPDFEESTKDRLRQKLLARTGMEWSAPLLAKDVLEACLILELEEPALEQLAIWMDKHQLAAIPRESLPQELPSYPIPVPLSASHRRWQFAGAAILIFLLWAAGAPVKLAIPPDAARNAVFSSPPAEPASLPVVSDFPLPNEYTYHPVNTVELKEWLQSRSSLLAEEPYFSAILDAAERNNLNPLLLFAITGQEQAYVPKEKKNAKQIANNPFNVHHSWQAYNTGISDSAHIASKTILSISRTRPDGAHPIQWLNTRYAEDPEWWVGVNSIFEKLLREIPFLSAAHP